MEKRKHPRLIAYNLFRLVGEADEKRDRILNVRNFSEGGLGFRSKNSIQPGAGMKLILNLPAEGKDIPLAAKVAWCRRKGIAGAYEIGIQFTDIFDDDQSIIREIVERNIQPLP